LKLGIIGLPGSGKTTVFRALTGGMDSASRKEHQEAGLAVVKIDDQRLDFLAEKYSPKKVTPVSIEYLDIPGLTGEGKPGVEVGDRVLANIRPVDALIHCVRLFDSRALGPAEPLKDLAALEDEMILSDLAVAEKRIDRITGDIKKGRKESAEELAILEEARSLLNEGKPLRHLPAAVDSLAFRGFAFLSAKPELFLVNTGEDRTRDEVRDLVEEIAASFEGQPYTAVDWLYADAEAEIARLDPKDAEEFLEDLQLEEGAKTRIVRRSFGLLRLIVFFTVISDEVRAWPLKNGETALTAAGVVHSDMQRGFIRAEVTAFDDFKEAGSLAVLQKTGKFRLEGKEYRVRDGDIILFRFNV